MSELDKTKTKEKAEIDHYELYDAGEFVNSILKYLDSDGCKNAIGDRGKEFENGFKAGLCMAPSVIMVYAKHVWRYKKEQEENRDKDTNVLDKKDGEQE